MAIRIRRREFIVTLASGAAAWPLAARAQQGRLPVVGVLRPNPKDVNETFAQPFRRYMKAVGWEEGRNIRFVFVWTEGRSERASALAAELVAQSVDLIISFGDPGTRAAQRATQIIPIVGMTDDMVGSGLAASMARPGGNTTGVSILASELDVKRLELLHEFVPQARRIAVLADPSTISTRALVMRGAHDLGVEVIRFEAQSSDEIARALDAIVGAKVEAVNVLASPLLNTFHRSIIDRMRDARLPPIYQWPEIVRSKRHPRPRASRSPRAAAPGCRVAADPRRPARAWSWRPWAVPPGPPLRRPKATSEPAGAARSLARFGNGRSAGMRAGATTAAPIPTARPATILPPLNRSSNKAIRLSSQSLRFTETRPAGRQ
jgi:putative tryptophan/tyrosine transport system substrate-binding protein